ncbi:MAG: hypothetical protein ABR562_02985 [Thermoplasmatota archaeon]|nr:hypothetical protein [Halobacteriales archaeon]
MRKVVVASLLVFVLLLAGCSSSKDTGGATSGPSSNGKTTTKGTPGAGTSGTDTGTGSHTGTGTTTGGGGGGTTTTTTGPSNNNTNMGTGPETWFLHRTGECATDKFTDTMDMADTPDDLDGCGSRGTGVVTGTDLGTFVATVPTHGFASGAAISAKIFITTEAPSQPTVTATVMSGGASVGSGSKDGLTGGVAGAAGVSPLTAWTEFDIDITTTADIPMGTDLQIVINVAGSPSAFFGLEEDHASQFTLT